MKKFIITLFTAVLFLSTNANYVSASNSVQPPDSEIIQNTAPDLSDYPYTIELNENEILFFNSKEDYNSYLQDNGIQTYNTGGYSTKIEVLSSVYKSKLWIGYHPAISNWREASSHTLAANRTYTVSGSYTYKGFSLSIGFSHSTGASSKFPADASRYSRLGVRGDFTFQHIKSTEYRYGKPTGRVPYYYARSLKHNEYIMTVYQ